MASTEFSSEGFDVDAIPSSPCEGEVVLEIGGTASVLNPPSLPNSIKTDKRGDSMSPISQSEELKAEGNARFKAGDYPSAYEKYSDAIEACPGTTGIEILELRDKFDEEERSRLYERRRSESSGRERDKEDEPRVFRPPPHPHPNELSIYHCNRAACSIQMEDYDNAISDCDVATLLNPAYTKALIRRMTAYEAIDKTDEALRDAKAAFETAPNDTKIRNHVLRLQRIEDERLEKLKAETMGKLKDLGNSILGNFGLSIDNFKAEKDPNTGSYSISFQQNK